MSKSIFEDGDTVLVAFGNFEKGITLKRGFILRDEPDTVGFFIVMTSQGVMNTDESIGFWKHSKTSSPRIVLIEKIVDRMSKEDKQMLKDIYLEFEQLQRAHEENRNLELIIELL
ncbi:MAG: hypothetical protein Q8O88_04130 [bacterium]|nr:hypothetical protein [bacterium]